MDNDIHELNMSSGGNSSDDSDDSDSSDDSSEDNGQTNIEVIKC